MIIKTLHIAGLRAYTDAFFEFHPGMNLLVGINGVGKTTVLDALRICLSHIQPEITASKNRKESFSISDIKIGISFLQISCDFEIETTKFKLSIIQQREAIRIRETEDIRAQTEQTPEAETITPSLKGHFPNADKSSSQSIGVFFSTKRSLIADRDPGKAASAGGQAAAFADALSPNREFNLRIFADWVKVQQVLSAENKSAGKKIDVLRKAVYDFLPGFSDLNVAEIDGVSTFTVVKSGATLNIRQLSDGERGVLALVLDIARRLSQANPGLENPLEGNGIILIDELDLHLHPKWQRTIAENLVRAFPNCQFIATSHSPQIIPSLKPEQVQIINNSEVITPDRSLGMDTNSVLKLLMEVDDRPEYALKAIKKVEQMIANANFEKAIKAMSSYKKNGLDLSEWSVFEARIARFKVIASHE